MPRIKKDKEFVIPEHIKAKISENNDTLLTIKRYGEYKVGENIERILVM